MIDSPRRGSYRRSPLGRSASLARLVLPLGAMLVIVLARCAGAGANEKGLRMTLRVNSSAFEDSATIPAKYTCNGSDVSPPLEWSNVPERTKSFALICDDPDAPRGTWVHWVLYGLPATTTSLPEGVPKDRVVKGVGLQGKNDFRRVGYGGPCPPPGKPHRYLFKLYALDSELSLKPGAEKKDLEKAMRGHAPPAWCPRPG